MKNMSEMSFTEGIKYIEKMRLQEDTKEKLIASEDFVAWCVRNKEQALRMPLSAKQDFCDDRITEQEFLELVEQGK